MNVACVGFWGYGMKIGLGMEVGGTSMMEKRFTKFVLPIVKENFVSYIKKRTKKQGRPVLPVYVIPAR